MPEIQHPFNTPNFAILYFGFMSVAFSYKTLIAFSFTGLADGWTLIENSWGPTTGKHLNHIDPDKSKRLDDAAFHDAWQKGYANMCINHARILLSLPAVLFDNRKLT